ncbi:MAG: hypothetical protein ACFFCZ_29260 [Promethearchaeota archaeon]
MMGLFNPNALLLSDLSFIIQWIVFFGLILAWILAYREKIDIHHKIILVLVVVHFLSILFMIFSFLTSLQAILASTTNIIAIMHSSFGVLVSLIILYTLMNMIFPDKIPAGLKFKNTKLLMRITAILWLFLVLSGSFLYLTWYPLI